MFAQLLRLFVDITVWRRGPQDLPASRTLAIIVLVVYVALDVVQVLVKGWPWLGAVWLIASDAGLQAVWLWGLLWYFGKRPRFLQTFTAYLGVGVLLTGVDLLMDPGLKLLGIAGDNPSNPWPLLYFGVALLSLGRVLQQATERSLLMGMALTWVIMLTIYAASQSVLPTA